MAETNETRETSWSNADVPQPMLAEFNGVLFETMLASQRDCLEFLHRRMKEDTSLAQQLLACRSLPDMYVISSRYLRIAADQYLEQSEKAIRHSRCAAEQVALAIEPRTSEGGKPTRH